MSPAQCDVICAVRSSATHRSAAGTRVWVCHPSHKMRWVPHPYTGWPVRGISGLGIRAPGLQPALLPRDVRGVTSALATAASPPLLAAAAAPSAPAVDASGLATVSATGADA